MVRPRVGDRVRVKSSLTKPKYNWGQVTSTSIGKLTRIDDDGDCRVDFPEQSDWNGLLSEMEVVGTSATEAVAVGARVKILSASDSSTTPYVGQDGDLVEDDGSGRPYRVTFADGKKWWFRKSEVVLASGSSTACSGSVLKTKEVGVRVRRGPDWEWGDQDGNGLGTTQSDESTGWIRVKWDHGKTNSYRIGKDGAYDLVVAGRIRCTKHHHDLIAKSLPNRCDVGGAGCQGVGTVYRCASGCDWDVCQVCFDANSAEKSAAEKAAAEKDPYPGEEGLQELHEMVTELWKEMTEEGAEELKEELMGVEELKEELMGKTGEEQWNILLEARDHLVNEWKVSPVELEQEWKQTLAQVPEDHILDMEEAVAAWIDASFEAKKLMLMWLCTLLEQEEAEQVTTPSSNNSTTPHPAILFHPRVQLRARALMEYGWWAVDVGKVGVVEQSEANYQEQCLRTGVVVIDSWVGRHLNSKTHTAHTVSGGCGR